MKKRFIRNLMALTSMMMKATVAATGMYQLLFSHLDSVLMPSEVNSCCSALNELSGLNCR